MFDHFDLLAPIYERLIPQPEPVKLRNLLRLPAAGVMLDAGGGTGRASSQLAPLVGKLVISDYSQLMLKQAQAKNGTCPVRTPVERLPFPSESFDRILVVDALHHFHNQPAAIAELVRVLKSGGRLVIEEPNINRFPVKLIALAEKLALMGSHFHTPTEIQAIILAQGIPAFVEDGNELSAWIVADKN